MRSDVEILEREQEILAYLHGIRGLRGRGGARDDLVYLGPEDLVLQHGRVFLHERAPEREFRHSSMPKACFHNAYRVAMESKDLIYCEGFAHPPIGIPCHHAWLVDLDGHVYDPTWDAALTGNGSHGSAYIGIPFKLSWLREHTGIRKGVGAIDVGYGGVRYTEAVPAEALIEVGLPLEEIAEPERSSRYLPAND